MSSQTGMNRWGRSDVVPGMASLIGFTGTRKGVTDACKQQLFFHLDQTRHNAELHHGDCIGADETAHGVAAGLLIPIVIHPPISSGTRAFCQNYSRICQPLGYIDRDRKIVEETHYLIACPEGEEKIRSGTWTTVRYARKLLRPILILWPNGGWTTENWK